MEKTITERYKELRKQFPNHKHVALYGDETGTSWETMMRCGQLARIYGVTDDPVELENMVNVQILLNRTC